MNEVEVSVSGLAIDAKNNSPVIILKEKNGDRVLPIWIGTFEANAIAMELAGVNFKRPLTYDLFNNLLNGLNAQVSRIVVSDLKDNTYFAQIFIESEKQVIKIDARPSDSIALALKNKSPLFVAEGVLDNYGDKSQDNKTMNAEELRDHLKRINPEDFGDFKL